MATSLEIFPLGTGFLNQICNFGPELLCILENPIFLAKFDLILVLFNFCLQFVDFLLEFLLLLFNLLLGSLLDYLRHLFLLLLLTFSTLSTFLILGGFGLFFFLTFPFFFFSG